MSDIFVYLNLVSKSHKRLYTSFSTYAVVLPKTWVKLVDLPFKV